MQAETRSRFVWRFEKKTGLSTACSGQADETNSALDLTVSVTQWSEVMFGSRETTLPKQMQLSFVAVAPVTL